MIDSFMERWGDVLFIASVIALTLLLFLEFAKLRVDVNRLCRYVLYRDAIYASMAKALEEQNEEEQK